MSPANDPAEPVEETAARYWLRAEDGDLAGLPAWLAADPRHREAFAAIGGALSGFEEHAAAPALLAARREALDQVLDRPGPSAAGFGRRALLAGGLGVILAPIGVLALRRGAKVYRTGIGEQHTVTLSDGSLASLDARTAMRVSLSGHRRHVELLAGRAYFTVAKDPTRPFTVTSWQNTVTALGTAFTVERRAGTWTVLLAEGRVAITTPRGRRELEPDQQLVATQTGEIQRVAAADVARGLGWRDGRLFFEDDALSAVIARLNDYAEPPLRVVGPAAGLRISGMFLAGRNDAFVTTILEYYPLDVRRTPDAIEIRMRPA